MPEQMQHALQHVLQAAASEAIDLTSEQSSTPFAAWIADILSSLGPGSSSCGRHRGCGALPEEHSRGPQRHVRLPGAHDGEVRPPHLLRAGAAADLRVARQSCDARWPAVRRQAPALQAPMPWCLGVCLPCSSKQLDRRASFSAAGKMHDKAGMMCRGVDRATAVPWCQWGTEQHHPCPGCSSGGAAPCRLAQGLPGHHAPAHAWTAPGLHRRC